MIDRRSPAHTLTHTNTQTHTHKHTNRNTRTLSNAQTRAYTYKYLETPTHPLRAATCGGAAKPFHTQHTANASSRVRVFTIFIFLGIPMRAMCVLGLSIFLWPFGYFNFRSTISKFCATNDRPPQPPGRPCRGPEGDAGYSRSCCGNAAEEGGI